ncbi:hypothetical protein HZA86_02525 [Candidatus Uhrbacteria bacterium]|nr:hypothetical protein [Candidatus Uhrbacteria bacterium]
MNDQPTIAQLLVASFSRLWEGVASSVPNVLAALLVLVIGWMVAVGLEGLVVGLLHAIKIPEGLSKFHPRATFQRLGLSVDVATIVGWLVKWFFIIVFLITAADILQWESVTGFLRTILFYVPNVIIAVIILFAGSVVAQATSAVVLHAVKASGVMPSSPILAAVAKWAVIVFSVLAALSQLGIATELVQILFTGFVFMVALAGGLAFGLGGKEQAGILLERLRKGILP